jgi:hypothetical protein
VHPYISMLIVEQRGAEMRATAAAQRLARTAKASSKAWPRRSARRVPSASLAPTQRTAPLSDLPAGARLVVHSTAGRPQSGPVSQIRSAAPDDRDAQLCGVPRR